MLALSSAEVPWRPWFLPLVSIAYLLAAAQTQRQVGPEGDEPHYLMVADSLLRDHDLSLEQDYSEGRYRSFHPATLAPHYRVRGKNGEIYSLHALGLSLLVLPAYAVGGYRAASFFMAGLGVLLAWQVRRLLKDVLADDRVAEMTALVVALSPPLWSYAGLVFTEVPAALGAGRGASPRPAAGPALDVGSAGPRGRARLPALAQRAVRRAFAAARALRVGGSPRVGRVCGPLGTSCSVGPRAHGLSLLRSTASSIPAASTDAGSSSP